MQLPILLLLGLVTGILSGVIGIGGGIVMIPALVFLFNMTQQQAQGTTLAMMVPPIGFLAAYTYYKAGFVDIKIAGVLCIGFFIGGLFGAKLSVYLPELVLKRIFAVILMLISVKMLLGK
jgi:hypothetical protein